MWTEKTRLVGLLSFLTKDHPASRLIKRVVHDFKQLFLQVEKQNRTKLLQLRMLITIIHLTIINPLSPNLLRLLNTQP